MSESYYSYAWSCSLCEGRTSFWKGLISTKLCKFLLMFSIGITSLSVLLLFPGALCYIFSILSDLTQMVNFTTQIPQTLSPALLDLFLSSDISICSTMASLSLGNSDHVVLVSVFIDFPSNS